MAGGFDGGWADDGKSLADTYVYQVGWSANVNRSFTPESKLNKLDQIWDPQWKGKIAWLDPRIPSARAEVAGVLLLSTREDKLRALMRDQTPALTQDRRQVAEWLIRGNYPIAIRVDPAVLGTFANQGIDLKQIQPPEPQDPGSATLSPATGAIGLVNRAPHSNAAKLFINWLLSKEGQTAHTRYVGLNSRRSDVPIADQTAVVDTKRHYENLQTEVNWPTYLKGVQIAKEMLK